MKKETEAEVVLKRHAPLISLLLGLAVVTTTAAYIIYRYANEKAYRKKWKDYDECGLA